MKKYVAYCRVSTKKQEYGLDSQENIITDWVNNKKGLLIATYKEKLSGRKNIRPELENAIEHCKKEDATLVIAKLDRLSRNASFLFKLNEEGTKIACCDLPDLNTLTLGIFATIAQYEAEIIRERTIAGLAVARAKGKKIGRKAGYKRGKQEIKETVEQNKIISDYKFKTSNKQTIIACNHLKTKNNLNTLQVAKELNNLGFKTTMDKKFRSSQVNKLLEYSNKTNKVA